jgi:hypothetical protein
MTRMLHHPILSVVAPPLAGISLAFVNELLGAASLAVALCYQVWRWRREARRKGEKK